MSDIVLVGIVVAAVLLAIGGLTLAVGLRGRRHFCPSCDHPPDHDGLRYCPACGAELDWNAMAAGPRRPSVPAIIAGGVLILAGLLPVGIGARVLSQEAKRYPYYSFDRVLEAAEAGRHFALVELNRRVNDDKLSASDHTRLAETALRHQTSVPLTGRTMMWIDMLASLNGSEKLTHEQRRRFYDQLSIVRLIARPRIRQGEQLYLKLESSFRHPSVSDVTTEVSLSAVRFGSSPAENFQTHSVGPCSARFEGVCSWAIARLPQLEPGRHEVICSVTECRTLTPFGARALPGLEEKREYEVSTELEVLSRTAGDSVRLLNDGPLAVKIQESILVGAAAVYGDHRHWQEGIYLEIDFGRATPRHTPLPCNVAFDIYLVTPRRDERIGEILCRAGNTVTFRSTHPMHGLRQRTISLRLDPKPSVARETLDVFEIWGESILFRNIPTEQLLGRPVVPLLGGQPW